MAFKWTENSLEDLVRLTRLGWRPDKIAMKLGCIERTVKDKQWALGLSKAQVRRVWTAAELQVIREKYPHVQTRVLAEELHCSESLLYQRAYRMGLSKTAEYLASPLSCRLRHGDNVGKNTRFHKGNPPPNKGLRRPGYAPGRMKETQFKRGNRTGMANINWRPVGTIRMDPDGYLRIKVRESQPGEATGYGNVRVWKQLHRHNWEEKHGPIPAGHILVFRDGDHRNCDPDNLELITRQQLLARQSIHTLPTEVASTIRYLGAVKRKLRERIKDAEKHDDRSAQPSI